MLLEAAAVMGRLTDTELATLSDKSSREERFVSLYRSHDYLVAYGKHTDLRVADDPQGAIGGDWEAYGALQRDFLVAQGLLPQHRLLDLGCGTGRLARKVAPYLDQANYVGVDLSAAAIASAVALSQTEGWAERLPRFVHSKTIAVIGKFDFVWAFSVLIHLPAAEVEKVFARVAKLLKPHGKFLCSYVPVKEARRTGLKQFKHPLAFLRTSARAAGMSCREVDWPGRQRILLLELAK